MSVESMSLALNGSWGVSPLAKLILVGIANHDGDGGAWPSVATLARYAEVSTRSVQRALSDLEQAGLITRQMNEGGNTRTKDHQRPNLYVLHLSPGDSSVTPPHDSSVTPPVTAVSPEPSCNPSYEPSITSSSASDEVVVETRADQSERIRQAWWDWKKETTGKSPLSNWHGVKTVIKRSLEAGYSEVEVKQALARLDAVSYASMARALGANSNPATNYSNNPGMQTLLRLVQKEQDEHQ